MLRHEAGKVAGTREAQMRAAREAQFDGGKKAARKTKAEVATLPVPLTAEEVAELGRLEAEVADGFGAFMAVGRALAEIRERRLYRVTHRTFEAYCRERWDMGRNYADKQIRAADAVLSLGMGTILPKTEHVAQALVPLAPKQRRSAWKKAVKTAAGRPVTAKAVRRAVREVAGGPKNAEGQAQAAPGGLRGESGRVAYLLAASEALRAAVRAEDDRWRAKIAATADRLDALTVNVRRTEGG